MSISPALYTKKETACIPASFSIPHSETKPRVSDSKWVSQGFHSKHNGDSLLAIRIIAGGIIAMLQLKLKNLINA